VIVQCEVLVVLVWLFDLNLVTGIERWELDIHDVTTNNICEEKIPGMSAIVCELYSAQWLDTQKCDYLFGLPPPL
jgi:hypothetical protein